VNEPERNREDNTSHEKNHHAPEPYWKRVHLHWGLWLGIVLMTIALLVYILSVNLALVPRSWQHQPQPAATSK